MICWYSLALSVRRAISLFICCDRSCWHSTASPLQRDSRELRSKAHYNKEQTSQINSNTLGKWNLPECWFVGPFSCRIKSHFNTLLRTISMFLNSSQLHQGLCSGLQKSQGYFEISWSKQVSDTASRKQVHSNYLSHDKNVICTV